MQSAWSEVGIKRIFEGHSLASRPAIQRTLPKRLRALPELFRQAPERSTVREYRLLHPALAHTSRSTLTFSTVEATALHSRQRGVAQQHQRSAACQGDGSGCPVCGVRCRPGGGGPRLGPPIPYGRRGRSAQGWPGVRCADPWTVCDEAGVVLIDERTASLTGSRVSRDAQVQLARALGARWLRAALLPPCKMVAVDLDETLHRGVLGEDGIEGVEVTPAHARLHAHLKQLAAGGVLLALVSRNEPEDVERLFAARRADYGLALEDFVAVEVSWGSKADAVRRAAAVARIGEDAVVFVDDNPGELLTVGLQCAAWRSSTREPTRIGPSMRCAGSRGSGGGRATTPHRSVPATSLRTPPGSGCFTRPRTSIGT